MKCDQQRRCEGCHNDPPLHKFGHAWFVCQNVDHISKSGTKWSAALQMRGTDLF